MRPFEAAIALLHVSALLGGLAAAYARLDKGGAGAQRHVIYPVAEEIAAAILNSLGISDGIRDLMNVGRFGRVRIVYPATVIFVVAASRTPLGPVHRFWHWFYCAWNIPFFRHYRNRRDVTFAAIIAITAFSAFLAISGLIIWQNEIVETLWGLKRGFEIETVMLVLLVVQAVYSWRDPQQRIVERCRYLENKVKERLEDSLEGPRRDLRRFQEAISRLGPDNAPPRSQ